jgi:hypothetical protein
MFGRRHSGQDERLRSAVTRTRAACLRRSDLLTGRALASTPPKDEPRQADSGAPGTSDRRIVSGYETRSWMFSSARSDECRATVR